MTKKTRNRYWLISITGNRTEVSRSEFFQKKKQADAATKRLHMAVKPKSDSFLHPYGGGRGEVTRD